MLFEIRSCVLDRAIFVEIHLREFLNGVDFWWRFGEATAEFRPRSIRNSGLNLMMEVFCDSLVFDTAPEPRFVRPVLGYDPTDAAGAAIIFSKERHFAYAPFSLVGNGSGFSPAPFSHFGRESTNPF